MPGFFREGSHIRTILTLLALFALGGCAFDVVAPPPAAAESSGAISFPTAGSLQRGSDGRFVMSDDPAVISGELRLPEGKGPFPAIVLAHGCNGTGNGGVERTWGHVARSSVGGCLKKGATIAGSPAAAELARGNLHAQLDELMK
jgi:hypothetical protein